jgi:hypothetical protein
MVQILHYQIGNTSENVFEKGDPEASTPGPNNRHLAA